MHRTGDESLLSQFSNCQNKVSVNRIFLLSRGLSTVTIQFIQRNVDSHQFTREWKTGLPTCRHPFLDDIQYSICLQSIVFPFQLLAIQVYFNSTIAMFNGSDLIDGRNCMMSKT